MQVSNNKVANIFMVLGVLFHEHDLKGFVDIGTCLKKLQRIKTAKDIHTDKVKFLLTKIQSDLTKSVSLETDMKEMLVEQHRKIEIILDKVDNQPKKWCYKKSRVRL